MCWKISFHAASMDSMDLMYRLKFVLSVHFVHPVHNVHFVQNYAIEL